MRARGRPKGARSKVLRDIRTLGVHHFAFLRASLLGLDLREAFDRYLAFGETTSDVRHIEARRRDLTAQLIDAGRRLDATLAPDARITRYVDLLRLVGPGARVAALPSLDDWVAAENMDPDMWSEAELLEEYRAAHGLDSASALEPPAAANVEPIRDRVQALNHLSRLLAVQPKATDPVEAWFSRPVAVHLRHVGMTTLKHLFQWVNARGSRWHVQVPRIGARRAAQVVAWLRSQAEALDLPLRDGLDEPTSVHELRKKQAAGRLAESPRFGMLPLERLALPAAFQGSEGVFRGRRSNSWGASDDLQAIRRWLALRETRPSTWRSYRKEVERFVLWSVGVRRKAVSSLDPADCQAYRSFLQAVPSTWVNPVAVERSDPRWRPFRGTPGPASQKQALVILQTMFEGLCDAGYLIANPMRAAMKGAALPSSPVDAPRAFSPLEWAHLLRCVDEEPVAPNQTRLRCLLELLAAPGLRLDELVRARRGDIRQDASPGFPTTWSITVPGRRGGAREVPLSSEIVALLDRHAADALPLDAVRGASQPLVFALTGSVLQWVSRSGRIVLERRVEHGGGALSAAGVHAVLKRFFTRVAAGAASAGLDPSPFEAASARWMRRTFIRKALADGMALETVAELVGHTSLDSTSGHSRLQTDQASSGNSTTGSAGSASK